MLWPKFCRLSLKFVEMINTLVAVAEIEEGPRFQEMIAGLASRHIKYGVKVHLSSIMGQVRDPVFEILSLRSCL
jgi:hypothetical protein